MSDEKSVEKAVRMPKKASKPKSAKTDAAEAAELLKKNTPMGKMLTESVNPPSIGDVVEGPVISIEKSGVFIDLHPYGTGYIYGREYINARDVIKKVNIGDVIAAKVVGLEHEEGYVELSLKEAKQALIWSEAEEAIRDKKPYDVSVIDANKGGLIMSWQGIQGFLPASQLKAEHYPRVTDGDKDKILDELRKLVGKKLSVMIITALPKEGKLIFSEKNPDTKEKEKVVGKYAVGDELDGHITGIVDFGIFVKVEEGLEGLVHISEIDWGLVEDPRTLYRVNDKVRVKVIDVKDGKISLSLKALKENPWKGAEKRYKKDDMVQAVIIKFNKYGALASVEEGIAGLVHVSEFGGEDKLRAALELGKSYPFKISLFDPKDQKMTLSYLGKK